jgi:hypothetical protein
LLVPLQSSWYSALLINLPRKKEQQPDLGGHDVAQPRTGN